MYIKLILPLFKTYISTNHEIFNFRYSSYLHTDINCDFPQFLAKYSLLNLCST